MTTASLTRQARYFQTQLAQYELRREYGIVGLDEQIAITRDLLMFAEQKLNERGLYLRRDGEVVAMPRERDKRPRQVAA
jgi:hypothetical protein